VAGAIFIALVVVALTLIVVGLTPLATGQRNARPGARVVGMAAWLLSIGVLSVLVAGIVLFVWIFRDGWME
jgi:hypothetical protein